MKKIIKKNTTLDNLAGQMAKGFQQVNFKYGRLNDQMVSGFKQVNENHEQLARTVSAGFLQVDQTLSEVNNKIQNLEDGQEQIKLRLDSVAYRFELVEVQRRVSHLEKKAGIRHP